MGGNIYKAMTTVAKTENKVVTTGVKGVSAFFNQDTVKAKFADILGQRANGFIASVLSAVSQSEQLKTADQSSIYLAAMVAASLDLPINSNLGLAYIIAYKQKQKDGTFKDVAQFQIGYRGFKQLAQRSGQFLKMTDTDVKEGELKSYNRMTGEMEFAWVEDSKERLAKKTIGYLSYFKLLNGFESQFYMTAEEVEAHAKKYSQTYKKYSSGLWKDEFDSMARKTVTKLNLSKNAPMSVDLQRAVVADQSVITKFDPTSEDTMDIDTEYVDHEEVALDVNAVSETKQRERVKEHIEKSKTLVELQKCSSAIPDDDEELVLLYDDKKRELAKK